MSSTEIIRSIEDKMKNAIEIARRVGDIVGYVSRTSPSLIDEEGGYVVFEVDPVVYFQSHSQLAQAGSLLGVVDIKTLNIISIQVVSIERKDILAELDIPEMYLPLPHSEASGLLTKTRIKAKPLLAYDPASDTVKVASFVIEPQSPVVLLRDPLVIQRVLGLPTEGVFLGFLTVGDNPAFGGNAYLFLPLKAFYQHVMVLGTTGSGKTTLLKNMIASIVTGFKLSDERAVIVIMDPNKDYVYIPLRPIWRIMAGVPEEDLVKSREISGYISKVKGVVIVLPITRITVERYLDKYETWARVLKAIAEDYLHTLIGPLSQRFNWHYEIKELDIIEEPLKTGLLRYVKAIVEINYGDEVDQVCYYIVPYAMRFTDLASRELVSLNPYFTRQAKDALQRILQALKSKNAYLETIYDLYDVLREARFRLEEKQPRSRKQITDPNKEYAIEVIKDLAIHKSTIENMIRQIAAIIDTGIFDVYVKGVGEDKYLHEPPIGELIERSRDLFNGYPIVVDLEYLQAHSMADPEKTISIVAFRILNKIFEWKMTRSRFKPEVESVIMFIDEAHRFFPSRSGVEEYIENVSGMIDRIARLGRARKLGLVFSTHSPKDVHDIILQLTNTKIVLRMDKSHLAALDLPGEYREFITKMSDRVAVLKSHVLRLGYATFKTTLPLVGHYDLSALG